MVKKVVNESVIKKTEGTLSVLWGFVAWLTGIIVSLAVGFGLVGGALIIPNIPQIVTETAGWIVVILTALGAILAVIDIAVK